MKKLLSSLIILTMLVCAFSCVAFAEEATTFDYTINGATTTSLNLAQAIQGYASSEPTHNIVVTKDGYIKSESNNMSVPANETVILDLGGHTITTNRLFTVKGTLIIKNGTINEITGKATYTFTVDTAGHLILEDATINSTCTTGAITLQQNSYAGQFTAYDGAVINSVNNVIYSNTPNSKTTIYGGTFTSTAANGRIAKFAAQSPVTIYGGTFINENSTGMGSFADISTNAAKIYGGTYSFKPTSCLSSDCAVSQNGSLYTVVPKNAVFNVEGKNLTTSWLGALNAVENDGIIKLTDDVTLDYALKVENTDKKFTFDLNGNTLTNTSQATGGNSSAIFHLADNSDVTIVNGTMVSYSTTAENAIMQGKSWGDTTHISTLTLGGDGNELSITASPKINLIAADAINGKIVVNDGVSLVIPAGSNATNNIYAMGTVEINGGIFKNNGDGSLDSGFINNLKLLGQVSKVEINGGTFNDDIEVECATSKIKITGGKFYGDAFNDHIVDEVKYVKDVFYDYQTFAPDGYYANEYDGYVKVETTSNKESVTAAIANASYDDGKGEDTVTKRFFKMVNSLDYAVVGFEIKAGEYTWDIPLTSVYSKVLVNGKVYNAGENEYVLTGAIGDVPNNYDGGFEVSAYAIDFEGNKVELN